MSRKFLLFVALSCSFAGGILFMLGEHILLAFFLVLWASSVPLMAGDE